MSDKDELKKKIRQSLQEEKDATENRFAKAEKIFSKEGVIVKAKAVAKSITMTKEESDYVQNVILDIAKEGLIITFSEVIRMSLKCLEKEPNKKQLVDNIIRFKSK